MREKKDSIILSNNENELIWNKQETSVKINEGAKDFKEKEEKKVENFKSVFSLYEYKTLPEKH
jgi:predicted oxidoreductase (fatty acid repression mutant protein)